MGMFGLIILILGVVLAVAVAYDLRARRRRHLAREFNEASRRAAMDATKHHSANQSKSRPTRMDGRPMGGPSLGP